MVTTSLFAEIILECKKAVVTKFFIEEAENKLLYFPHSLIYLLICSFEYNVILKVLENGECRAMLGWTKPEVHEPPLKIDLVLTRHENE